MEAWKQRMNIDDVEKFSKKMEKWHDIIFPKITILFMMGVMMISSIAITAYYERVEDFRESWDSSEVWLPFSVFQVLFYVGIYGVPIYMIYTILFTKFRFPISFKGDGGGRKIKPIRPL